MNRRVRAAASRRCVRIRFSGRHAGSEGGAVTAETAMVLPVLVALTVALVWVLSLGVAQVRVVDAARETARALARGESDAAARSLGQRVAPAGATIAVRRTEGVVVVVVRGEVSGPGGLFGALPGATVRAEAVAATEAS